MDLWKGPRPSVPIVITAFGTTTRALETYDRIEARCRERFPECEVRWAYSSRMVKDRVKHRRALNFPDPVEVLSALYAEGHTWAVVQSLHVICGHEFHRLARLAEESPIRTSMGLPLLTAPDDLEEVARVLSPELCTAGDEAAVLVGHGTDHPAWCAYAALEQRARRLAGPHVYVGVVEGSPGPEEILERVLGAGYERVRLFPFMLVAGRHFLEDLSGPEDSWKSAFEARGLGVALDGKGLGARDGVIEVFLRHAAEAVDVIPESAGPRRES